MHLLNWLHEHRSKLSLSWSKNSCLLWNTKVNYCVHKGPPPTVILTQKNRNRSLLYCFRKIRFNIILPAALTRVSQKSSPSYRVSDPMHAKRPIHLILFGRWIVKTENGKMTSVRNINEQTLCLAFLSVDMHSSSILPLNNYINPVLYPQMKKVIYIPIHNRQLLNSMSVCTNSDLQTNKQLWHNCGLTLIPQYKIWISEDEIKHVTVLDVNISVM
jgi:hypothetical protein